MDAITGGKRLDAGDLREAVEEHGYELTARDARRITNALGARGTRAYPMRAWRRAAPSAS